MATPGRNDKEKLRLREADLIRRVLGGDVAAFAELVRPYMAKIKKWCREGGKLCNPEDVEDGVQDTLIETYRSLSTFDCARKFKPWLRKIARRRGIDTVRRQGRHWDMQSFEFLVADEETGLDHGWQDKRAEDPHDLACQNEQNEMVCSTLEKLPERQREALILQCRGFSMAEIAVCMNTSISAVDGLLRRARKRFKQIYKTRGEGK